MFKELIWLKNRIVIPKELIGKQNVYIPFTFCYSRKEMRLIFIEYGKLEDTERWLPIFKTLVAEFEMDASLPEVDHVTYWDLMRGTTKEISYPESFLAPKERVLQTARRLVELSIGRSR